MNEVLSNESKKTVPGMFSGVNAEDLVKPKAGIRQSPKPNPQKNKDQASQSKTVISVSPHLELDAVAEFSVDASVKKLYFLESVSITTIGKAAVIRSGVYVNADGTFVHLGGI